MMELKPCPFCGGEAKLELTTQYYTGEPEMENAFIRCMKCSVWTDEYVYATEAAAAWNTRHVETCRWEYPQGVNGWLGYMICSECGERFDKCVTDTAHYCPSCGRKVEG